MQTTHGQNDQRVRFGCVCDQRPNTAATTTITQKSNPSSKAGPSYVAGFTGVGETSSRSSTIA